MAHTRSARLPVEHVVSELLAFPLASEASFANPVTHLDPMMSPPTARLWRHAERDLLASAPGMSLDELVVMRDLFWFGESGAPRPLRDLLRAATKDLVVAAGGGMRPKRYEPPSSPYAVTPGFARTRWAWRWRCLALPSDLLLSADSTADWLPALDFFSPPVRQLLRKGFAETHLHVGASLDFPTVWALTMARLADPGVPMVDLAAPGAGGEEGTLLLTRLTRAALTRLVLAAFRVSGEPGPVTSFLHGSDFRQRVIRSAGSTTYTLVMQALHDLATGSPKGARLADMRAALGVLSSRPIRRPTDLATARLADPVSALLPRGAGGSGEQRYIADMCRYLDHREQSGQPDHLAAQLFWQTVRVRNQLYRHVTQRPLTPGLAWFIRFYARMSQVRGSVSPGMLVTAAHESSGAEFGLRSLEMRTSPDDSTQDIRAWIDAVAGHSANPDVGSAMVLHFVKHRGGGAEEGRPSALGRGSSADPKANPAGSRHSRFFLRQQRKATSLATVLQRWPRTQFVVRALDVCSDELAVPAWVLRPLLAQVRQASAEGIRFLRFRGEAEPPPLHTTVHVGEDFTHILTGLRHIDEAIQLFELGEGDRLGHAVALGVDPQQWALRAGRTALPIEDRVFDLAWEWGWWTRRGDESHPGRLAYLEREVARLATAWFDEPVDVQQVEQLQADLASTAALAAAGFPDRRKAVRSSKRNSLLARYLQESLLFVLGRKSVWVEPSAEVEAVIRIGTALRHEVAARSLAIEINPTSNMLIGDLGNLESHPLWRLRPPRPRADLPPLTLTVGSDDPLVFNSRLPEEYQVLSDALMMAGLTDSEALAWLDGVRRAGLERQFVTDNPHRHEHLFSITNPKPLASSPL